MTSQSGAPAKISPKAEIVAACLILVIFLLINLVSATRSPTVYIDEVEYTDPAANLYLGNGFTSTVWAQEPHEFWCGNVPLQAAMLYCFFKLFGFGLLQARMLSAVQTASGALLIWIGLRRSRLIESPCHRLLSMLLVLSGSVSALTFRMARPDATMFFVCALVFFAATAPVRRGVRFLAMLFSSALLPFGGIPMLPYAGLFSILYAAVFGRRNMAVPVAILSGLLVGVLGLFIFYRHFGVWREFVEIILPFTVLRSSTQAEPHSLKTLILGQSLGDENLLVSFFGNPTEFLSQKTMFDYSAFLLFIVVVLLAWKCWTNADDRQRKVIMFIILVTLITPPVMRVAGHYRSYYRWMTYEPLCVIAPRLLEIAGTLAIAQWVRRGAIAMICLSFLLGVPFRTLTAVPDWRARSIQPLERAAADMARSTDVVVCSQKAYFALKPRVKVIYGFGLPARGEFRLIKDFQPQTVTLLCVLPEDRAKIFQAVGGEWEKIPTPEDAALAHSRYPMEFYRRRS